MKRVQQSELIRLAVPVVLVLALLSGASVARVDAQARFPTQASWLIDMARNEGHMTEKPDSANVQRLIALLEAAIRLDDHAVDAYPLLADAYAQLGNAEKSRDALGRHLELEPQQSDVFQRWLEMTLATYDTADQRLALMQSQVQDPTLTPESTSIVFTRMARLHAERGQRGHAVALLDRAVEKNPYNLDAINLQFELAHTDPTPAEEAAFLLNVITIQPMAVNKIWELARLLDDNAQHRSAQFWYQRASMVHARAQANLPRPLEYDADVVRSLFDSGNYETVVGLAEQINTPPPPPEQPETDEDAEGVVVEEPPANQPATPPFQINLPVLLTQADALRLLDNADDAQAAVMRAKEEISEKLAEGDDLAMLLQASWFYMFYEPDPAQAFDLAKKAATIAPEDPLVRRALGLAYLMQNNVEKSRELLEPMANFDQTAAWGLATILLQLDKENDAIARLLDALEMRRTGWAALRIVAQLSELGVEPPKAELDAELAIAVNGFQPRVLKFQQNPQAVVRLGLYPLPAEEVEYPHPVSLNFVLSNKGGFDLCMGQGKMFRPEVTLTAQLNIPGGEPLLFERFTNAVLARHSLLLAGEEIITERTVQIGELDLYLRQRPQMTSLLAIAAVVDPVMDADGKISPNVGGWIAGPVRVKRTGFEVTHESLQDLTLMLQDQNIDQRDSAVRILTGLVAERHLPEDQRNYPHEAVNAHAITTLLLTVGTRDGAWQVRSRVAEGLSIIPLTEEQISKNLKPMITDPHWLVRLLTIRSIAMQHPERFMPLVAMLATRDQDLLVRQMASSFQTVAALR